LVVCALIYELYFSKGRKKIENNFHYEEKNNFEIPNDIIDRKLFTGSMIGGVSSEDSDKE